MRRFRPALILLLPLPVGIGCGSSTTNTPVVATRLEITPEQATQLREADQRIDEEEGGGPKVTQPTRRGQKNN